MCFNPTYHFNPYLINRGRLSRVHLFDEIHYNDVVAISPMKLPHGFYWPEYLRQCIVKGDKRLVDSFSGNAYTFLNGRHFDFDKNVRLAAPKLERYFMRNSESGVTVPLFVPFDCGHCLACRMKRATQLRNRLVLEFFANRDKLNFFFTLTYDEKHLPLNNFGVPSVCKSDVTSFIKRLYTYLPRIGVLTRPRHFIQSEYGSLRGRPHYHGILFGFDRAELESAFKCGSSDDDFLLVERLHDFIHKVWQLKCEDFCLDVRKCDGGAAAYVSKYVFKDAVHPIPPLATPNFYLSSRKDGLGLGASVLKDPEFKDIVSDLTAVKYSFPLSVIRNGAVKTVEFKMTLPSYIFDKLYPSLSKLVPGRIQDALFEFFKLYLPVDLLKADGLLTDVCNVHNIDYGKFLNDCAAVFDKYSLFLPLYYKIYDDEFCDDYIVSQYIDSSRLDIRHYDFIDSVHFAQMYFCISILLDFDFDKSFASACSVTRQRVKDFKTAYLDSLPIVDVCFQERLIRDKHLKHYYNHIKDGQ